MLRGTYGRALVRTVGSLFRFPVPGAMPSIGYSTRHQSSTSTSTSPATTDEEEVPKRATTYYKPPPLDADMHMLANALKTRPSPPSLTFLLGGPGAGKGTLSDLIADRTNRQHVSIGAILRSITSSGTAEGRKISATMSRGGILPSELTTQILLRHLCDHAHSHWVVDGYPRTFANAIMFDSLQLAPTVVVAMEIDEAVMKERLRRRQRRDDVDYIVQQRLVQFHSEWESIKEFYKRRHLLVEIDADGSPETVWHRYTQAIQKI